MYTGDDDVDKSEGQLHVSYCLGARGRDGGSLSKSANAMEGNGAALCERR